MHIIKCEQNVTTFVNIEKTSIFKCLLFTGVSVYAILCIQDKGTAKNGGANNRSLSLKKLKRIDIQ